MTTKNFEFFVSILSMHYNDVFQSHYSSASLTSIHQLVFPSKKPPSRHPRPRRTAYQWSSTSKSCTATLFKLWPQGFSAFVQPAAHWSSPSVSRSVFRSSYAHSTHTARTAPSSRPVRHHKDRTLAVRRQSHSFPHSSSTSHALAPPPVAARTYPRKIHTTWPRTSISPYGPFLLHLAPVRTLAAHLLSRS